MTGPGTGSRADGPIPNQVTDRVLLREAPDQSAGQIMHGWAGPWPPPPKLVRFIGRLTGEERLVDPTEQDPALLAELVNHSTVETITYVLHRASEIERPALPSERWFRGAEYVREIQIPG